MEILGRRCGVCDLDVILSCEREKTFESRAGMLWTGAFEAVRQQEHQSAQQSPFIFGACDELIDHHLGNVYEVAELRFPKNEAIRAFEAVTVLEADDTHFGEGAIDDFDRPLILGE